MTNQDAFDTVVRHLLTQNTRSWGDFSEAVGSGDGCMYRGDNGTKCAIGCLIPDELYSPKMENKTYSTLMKDHADVAAVLGDIKPDLLRTMQGIHDGYEPNRWSELLKETGMDHKLDLSVFEEF